MKFGKNATETLKKVKWAYGVCVSSRSHDFRWHKELLSGCSEHAEMKLL